MTNALSRWLAVFLFAWIGAMQLAEAKLKVVTTSTDIGDLVRQVGGERVDVDVLAKGTQDLHQLEPKPSFMARLSRAQLLVSNGLALEIGWLPGVVRGARNPKLNPGQPGYLELGDSLNPLEKKDGSVSRAQGDVHPEGNPHWSMDPIRVAQAAELIGSRLAQLDSANGEAYKSAAQTYAEKLKNRTKEWTERIKKSGVKEVITYHRTLVYFLDRFGIAASATLEPKPGIPPSAQHILEVMRTARDKKINLVLVENYFDTQIADRVAKDVPGMKVVSVPVAVDGKPEIKTNEDKFEALVKVIEGAK